MAPAPAVLGITGLLLLCLLGWVVGGFTGESSLQDLITMMRLMISLTMMVMTMMRFSSPLLWILSFVRLVSLI